MGSPDIRDLCVLEIRYTELARNSGLHVLWTAVMGNQTLADLVAGIFTGVSSALASVKSGLEAAWDGIKSAGQFIGNAALQPIAYSLQQMGNNLLRGFLTAISSIFDFSVSEVQDSFNLQLGNISASTGVRLSGLSLIFELGESQQAISVVDLLKNSVETLGVGQNLAFQQMEKILDMYIQFLGSLYLTILLLITLLWVPAVLTLWFSMATAFASLSEFTSRSMVIYDSIKTDPEKKEYASWMNTFYGSMKDIFLALVWAILGIISFGAVGVESIATFGVKLLYKVVAISDPIMVILDFKNIFNAHYPSYIMNKILTLFVLLLIPMVVGAFIMPVLIGFGIYYVANYVLHGVMESHFGGLA